MESRWRDHPRWGFSICGGSSLDSLQKERSSKQGLQTQMARARFRTPACAVVEMQPGPSVSRLSCGFSCKHTDELRIGGWFHRLAGPGSICSLPGMIRWGMRSGWTPGLFRRSSHHSSITQFSSLPHNNPSILSEMTPSRGNLEPYIAAVRQRRFFFFALIH